MKPTRRRFMKAAAAVAAALPLSVRAANGGKMKIGIVGSGRVGGTLGGVWVRAGHEVMFSSRDLERDKALAAKILLGMSQRSSNTFLTLT